MLLVGTASHHSEGTERVLSLKEPQAQLPHCVAIVVNDAIVLYRAPP
jgi:hypothetical protein